MMVERIFTRTPNSDSPIDHHCVKLVAGAGIEGDRYFDKHEEPGQSLTLIEAEEIEAFCRAHGRPQDFSVTGRNFITRGARLNELVGREFMVGGLRLVGVELCEPCMGFGLALQSPSLSPAEVVKHWVHRAGLRASVLSSGELSVGAQMSSDA